MIPAGIERPPPAVDLQAAAERRQAARALLRQPLLDAAGDDDLRLVRRHRDDLIRLFADGLGYRLVVEPGVARLFKAGLGRDPSRPLRRRTGRPFTPRGYALLCLTVAALTRTKSQLLVDELVAEVRSAAADAGIEVDLDAIADRRALHGALLALVDLGVLEERDGDLEHWADQHSLALLDVRRDRLALLVAAPVGSAAGPQELLDVTALPSAAGGARVAVRRRLVESPVLSVTDLTDEQAEWWRRNRNREREWFADRFGLEVELRAEGAVAVDPDDELTDVTFPGPGSGRHFALLWLDTLVAAVRDTARALAPGQVWQPVTPALLEQTSQQVFADWGRGLKRAHREDIDAVRAEATDILTGMGLVRVDPAGPGGSWQLHAAAARYRARPALAEAARTGEMSLFDQSDEEDPDR